LVSCLPGHHDCKKVARQIKTGYVFFGFFKFFV
jgi:hypothetical protein